MSCYLIVGGNSEIARDYITNKINLDANEVIITDKKFSHNSLPDHPNINMFEFDSTNQEEYKELLSYLENTDHLIDKILFTIGINPMKNFFTSDIQEFSNTIDTNFTTLFITLKKIYSYLNKKSSIVVLASQNGTIGHEDRIDYGPSKAALIQMVKNLSVDFNKYSNKDIKINCISPGYVLSKKSESFFSSPKGKKSLAKTLNGKPVLLNELSNTISFMLDDDNSSFRGQNIVLDNGYTIL